MADELAAGYERAARLAIGAQDAQSLIDALPPTIVDDILAEQTSGKITRSRHLPASAKLSIVTGALRRGRPAAVTAATRVVMAAYRDELGDDFDSPSADQVTASTREVLRRLPLGLVRVPLARLAAENVAPAAQHVSALLREGTLVPPPAEPGDAAPARPGRPAPDRTESGLPAAQRRRGDRGEAPPDEERGEHEHAPVEAIAERDFSVLDRLLIDATVSNAQSIVGAFSREDLTAGIEELVQLNRSRDRSWFHVGFAGGLGVVDPDICGDSLHADNHSRRRWRLAGLVTARLRIDDGIPPDLLTKHRDDLIEIAVDPVMGLDLCRPILAALLHADDTEGAGAILDRRPLLEPFGDLQLELDLLETTMGRARSAIAAGQSSRAELVLDDGLGRSERLLRREASLTSAERRAVVTVWALLLISASGAARHRAAFALADERLTRMRADDVDVLPGPVAANVHVERALAAGQISKLSNLRFGETAEEREQVGRRLAHVAPHVEACLALDPMHPQGAFLAAAVAMAEADWDAAARWLEVARSAPVTTGWDERFRADLSRQWAIVTLSTYDTDLDGPAVGSLIGAAAKGRYLTEAQVDDVLSALMAMGSAHLDDLVASLVRYPTHSLPAARLVELLDMHPEFAVHTTAFGERVGFADRLKVLFAGADAAARCGLDETFDDVIEAIDGHLEAVGSGSPQWNECAELVVRHRGVAERIGSDGVGDWLIRCAVHSGDRERAADIAIDLLARQPPTPERRSLVQELCDLVEAGYGKATADDYRDRLRAELPPAAPSQPAAGSGGRPVRVLFVGGDERQARHRDVVTGSLADHVPPVDVTWIHPGWSTNWTATARECEVAMAECDIVVLMPFLRTNLGKKIRSTAGRMDLRWHACTGWGPTSIENAIRQAVALVPPDHGR